jgi:tellurite resistance protein TerC
MNIRTDMWLLFASSVFISLAIDLGRHHRRRTDPVSWKDALSWTIFWISLSLIFNAVLYVGMGTQKATEFFTAYLIEKSLSIDNLFVFMLIFEHFKISHLDQPKVLKYGILGAILMRFVLIFTGVKLVSRFHWFFYVLGVVLVVTAIQMIRDERKEMKPETNWALRLFKHFWPIATPWLAILVVIEASDLVFAVDSIPAVLAISRDPFIVFSSNVFAILGLRSMYFVLHGVMGLFRYLKYGLGVVLIFIGVKMLLIDVITISTPISLLVVVVCLAVSIACSLALKPRHE